MLKWILYIYNIWKTYFTQLKFEKPIELHNGRKRELNLMFENDFSYLLLLVNFITSNDFDSDLWCKLLTNSSRTLICDHK